LILRVVLLFCCLAVGASADTYKCRGASGVIAYGDKPCPKGDGQDYRPPRAVAVPPLPSPDLSSLPADERGRPVLSRSGGAAIVLEKQEAPGPINVLAACSALVTRCVKPGERELDDCFHSAPRCASARPWLDQPYRQCCPEACWRAYDGKRRSGVPPLAAFDQVLFGADKGAASCLPLQ
jgi:hypothetical protein